MVFGHSRDKAADLRVVSWNLLRRVGADCAIEVDGNAYSVPWRLIGERVRVTVGGGSVTDAAKMVGLCLGNDVADPAQLDNFRAVIRADVVAAAGADGPRADWTPDR